MSFYVSAVARIAEVEGHNPREGALKST